LTFTRKWPWHWRSIYWIFHFICCFLAITLSLLNGLPSYNNRTFFRIWHSCILSSNTIHYWIFTDRNLVIDKWIIFILWQNNLLTKITRSDYWNLVKLSLFCYLYTDLIHMWTDQKDMWNNLDMTLTFKWPWLSNDWILIIFS
jgi:hypothetical protein